MEKIGFFFISNKFILTSSENSLFGARRKIVVHFEDSYLDRARAAAAAAAPAADAATADDDDAI